jgi:hypothetical protein
MRTIFAQAVIAWLLLATPASGQTTRPSLAMMSAQDVVDALRQCERARDRCPVRRGKHRSHRCHGCPTL